MFGDWGWIERRSAEQADRQNAWLASTHRPLIIELGAGTAIPSVRHFSQYVVGHHAARLVRINPGECDVPTRLDVGLPMGAAAALVAIARVLGSDWEVNKKVV